MVLRCPRFSGDPTLEACLAGTQKMRQPDRGLGVKRVQEGLMALDRSVGPAGADGKFGPDTAAAVSAYKADRALPFTDPVVGTGTITALDEDLFVDPPEFDPAFKEFSPAVVNRRLEPFVGFELASLIDTPLNSWRHMIGRFALDKLNSGELLGIVARSRSDDLRGAYLAIAELTQPDDQTAEFLFDDTVATLGDSTAVTLRFDATDGSTRSLILFGDSVVLGWATLFRRSTRRRAPATLRAALAHELTHVRNQATGDALRATPDSDSDTYVDPALAEILSAVRGATAEMMAMFVEEICSAHLEWIVLQETNGNLTAPQFLPPEQLVEAARFYFEDTGHFDGNGYVPAITIQGESSTLLQIGLWLRRCQEMTFSSDGTEDARTSTLFGDAAAAAEQQSASPPAVRAAADGLSPLAADFVLPE